MFFFFKQKTAYEMRISDWSSDVCSSDLQAAEAVAHRGNRNLLGGRAQFVRIASPPDYQQGETVRIMHIHHIHVSAAWIAMFAYASVGLVSAAALISMSRSEEHTSELQSLMRISYAVFCLTKKTTTRHQIYT